MKILVTGSSGLVGSSLVSFLGIAKHQVIKLVRKQTNLKSNEISWDPEKGKLDPHSLEGFDAVVHLAGENLMGRWSEDKKKEILNSRVKSTQLLCKVLSQLQQPPSVLVSASAIGYYGNQGDMVLTESSPKGIGFLADVCDKWEKATIPAVEKGIRTVNLRIGIVLSKNGGALKLMLLPFQLGMGGYLGDGKQYMSWIDIDDLTGIIYYAIQKSDLKGPVNAISPYPVTNYEFTKTLGSALNRPTFLAVPSFVINGLFGEMGEAVLLNSTRVRPEVLLEHGFHFDYPKLGESLEKLLA